MKKQEEHNYVYKFKKFVSKIHQKLLRLEKRDLLQVIFFYSLNFFSLEFHLSLFYLFWCLLFLFVFMKLLKEFFLLLFLSCQFSHFFVCFFAKEESSQFLFFHFFVKKKEKKQWIFFSHFFSWYQAASCVLTIFFLCSFVCLSVGLL